MKITFLSKVRNKLDEGVIFKDCKFGNCAAFMCQHNTHMNYYSLKERTFAMWTSVVHISTVAALIMNAIVGYACYLTFKGLTQGDLFENYCEHDDLINAARAVFALSIMLTYPMECLVARQVIEHFLNNDPSAKSPLSRHVLLTMAICFLATAISLSTNCLGIVLEINVSYFCYIIFTKEFPVIFKILRRKIQPKFFCQISRKIQFDSASGQLSR